MGGSCPASLGTGLWSEKLFKYRAIVGHLDATLADHATMFTATCKSLFSNMKEKKNLKEKMEWEQPCPTPEEYIFLFYYSQERNSWDIYPYDWMPWPSDFYQSKEKIVA